MSNLRMIKNQAAVPLFRRGILGDYTVPPAPNSKMVYIKPDATVAVGDLFKFSPDSLLNGDRVKGIQLQSSYDQTNFIAGNETRTLNNSDEFNGGILELHDYQGNLVVSFPLSVLVSENTSNKVQMLNVDNIDWQNCGVRIVNGGTITSSNVILFKVYYE